jgi:predicted  nucleic acid-binding Zn-ribbon protein
MFGKKNRKIKELTNEIVILKAKISSLEESLSIIKDCAQDYQFQCTAAHARLREIQDKSNARTRKYRAKMKANKIKGT